jgi:F0F1-type ATP synthase gamma subunit
MGWGSGTEVFESIWSSVRTYIPDDKKVEVCSKVIKCLQRRDWDCENDFIDLKEYPEFNEALALTSDTWKEYFENNCPQKCLMQK